MRLWRKAAAVAVVALTVAACSSGDEAAAPPPVHYVGEAFPADNIEIRVTDVEERQRVGGEYFGEQAAEGGVLVTVRYTIKNTSPKPVSAFSAPKLVLIDPAGTKYEADAGKTVAYSTELDLDQKAFSDLNPGITVKGATVFEVSSESFDRATWNLALDSARGARIALTDKPAAKAKAEAPPPEPQAVAPQPAAPVVASASAPAAPETIAPPAAPVQRATPVAVAQPELPDYSARERRLAALIENANVRDTTGETQRNAAAARAERARCSSRTCFERSYAAQESILRQWEGAEEIVKEFASK